MHSLKRFWEGCFKLNDKLNRRDFWTGLLITIGIMIVIIKILMTVEIEEAMYSTLFAVAFVVFIVGLWTSIMRRLTDTGRSKALLLLGVVPFLNLLLVYFLLQGGVVPHSEEELHKA